MTKTHKARRDNTFQSYNIRVFTPDGTLYVIITVDNNKDPFNIFVTGPKNAQPLQIWIAAICNVINEMWKNGIHTSTIIRCLDTPYSARYAQNDNGVKIYSGPDGIKWALGRFLQLKQDPSWDLSDVASRVG